MKPKRWYNGQQSKLMDDLYDQLISRDPTIIDNEWWASFSLYLARSCVVVEKKMGKDFESKRSLF